MIKLNSKDIDDLSNIHLNSIQQIILEEITFEEKVKKANAKWDNKSSSNDAKTAFRNIKDTLIEMCVGIEICVYCEQNEATDIEHIYPKKLYPEKAFTWENYVLACSKCNTHHKSDNFKIFNPKNSIIEQDVKPARGAYTPPVNDDALFINQRLEDPMDLLELDLTNQLFIFTEKYAIGTREYQKAKFTKDLLGLNTRASLVANRKNATIFYISRLEKFVAAKKSMNFDELIEAINDDWGGIDTAQNFTTEKDRVLKSIKDDILSFSHPTVWKELIRQRNHLPKTNLLLNQVPEVLTWPK